MPTKSTAPGASNADQAQPTKNYRWAHYKGPFLPGDGTKVNIVTNIEALCKDIGVTQEEVYSHLLEKARLCGGEVTFSENDPRKAGE